MDSKLRCVFALPPGLVGAAGAGEGREVEEDAAPQEATNGVDEVLVEPKYSPSVPVVAAPQAQSSGLSTGKVGGGRGWALTELKTYFGDVIIVVTN